MPAIERFFVSIKDQVIADLGDQFEPTVLDQLSLSLTHTKQTTASGSDHYRSKTAKVPAYYNPNSHTIHLNTNILESANLNLIENIFYHELVHAASHHDRLRHERWKVLKSGLKLQVWNRYNRQTILNRHLNEGLTQYFANMYTNGGPAYRNEVEIIGKLVQKIGLSELKGAYFGPAIDELEKKTNITLGSGVFETMSRLIDLKRFDDAKVLVS